MTIAEIKTADLGHLNPMQYTLYGVLWDGSRCYYRTAYWGRTTPDYATQVVNPDGSKREWSGHPRRGGITKANGWSVNPEHLHVD